MIKKMFFLLLVGVMLCNCAFASDCEIIHKSVKYYENRISGIGANDVCSYYNLAEEYLRKKKFQDALYFYKKITEIDSQEETAYVRSAELYSEYMNENKANTEWARLVKNIPDSKVGNKHLAMAYHSIFDYDNALKHINKAIEVDNGQDTMLFVIRGNILKDAGNYEKAIQDYTRFIDGKQFADIKLYNLYYAITYDERGECYKVIGKIKEAEKDKQKYEEYFSKKQAKYSIFRRIGSMHDKL